jgi:lipopolysaccharide biosynthesis glycosyltransferase
VSHTNSALTVRSLICHRDVDMAIACLGSLLKFSAEPLKLVLHNDGSLTPEDQARLTSELGEVSFVSRLEADELTSQLLKNYPNCYRYRHGPSASRNKNENIWSLKLFDVALLGDEDIAYCDTDILFFRPFSQLFHFADSKTSALFMQDSQESYSIHFSTLLNSHKLRLPSRVNAGLIFCRKQAFDLDFIEWFLSQEEFKYIFAFAEQTCWAALGYRAGCQQWNPQQISMMRPGMEINNHIIAGHFTTPVRYLLKNYLPQENLSQSTDAPVIVETVQPPECSILGLMKVHARIHLGAVKRTMFSKRKTLEMSKK